MNSFVNIMRRTDSMDLFVCAPASTVNCRKQNKMENNSISIERKKTIDRLPVNEFIKISQFIIFGSSLHFKLNNKLFIR